MKPATPVSQPASQLQPQALLLGLGLHLREALFQDGRKPGHLESSVRLWVSTILVAPKCSTSCPAVGLQSPIYHSIFSALASWLAGWRFRDPVFRHRASCAPPITCADSFHCTIHCLPHPYSMDGMVLVYPPAICQRSGRVVPCSRKLTLPVWVSCAKVFSFRSISIIVKLHNLKSHFCSVYALQCCTVV